MTHDEIMEKITGKRESLVYIKEMIWYRRDLERKPIDALDTLLEYGFRIDSDEQDAIVSECRGKIAKLNEMESSVSKMLRWLTRPNTKLLRGPDPLTDDDWDKMQEGQKLVKRYSSAMDEDRYYALRDARELLIAAGELPDPDAEKPEI